MHKIVPTFEEFRLLAKKGNLIPVCCDLLADMDTPVSAYVKLRTPGHGCLLESVEGGEKWARYSFLGTGATTIFRSKGKYVEIVDQGKQPTYYEVENPLELVRELMKRYRPVVPVPVPRFYGGAVGYISYDTVRFFERLPSCAQDTLGVWDIYLVIYENFIIFDNVEHTIKIVSSCFLPNYSSLRRAYEDACHKIEQVVTKLRQPFSPDGDLDGDQFQKKTRNKLLIYSSMSKSRFLKAVRQAKRYVRKGDVIQIVLSQRLSVKEQVPPFHLYRSLRVINPSPYMFFLQYPDYALIGASPEVLVRLEGRTVEVRPIAGTRARGRDPREDERLEAQLRKDEKEKAEHIMLVDLGRNDIGRVAVKGSVVVDEFMKVERYSHVMHLVSHVRGILTQGRDMCGGYSRRDGIVSMLCVLAFRLGRSQELQKYALWRLSRH